MSENLNLQTVETVDTGPFRKLVMTIGELPTAFVESMTYYELLAWFTNYLETVIIPTVNNNAECVEELQGKFIELKDATEQEIDSFETNITALFNELHDYVENYFDNLDVQEEINNKLDEMAENGQLTQLIAQFLSLNAIMSFPNVASMKAAENLVNGSTVETYGFYNVNDKGGAKYLVRTITNDDVVDEKTIIELYDNTLIAELIQEPEMSVRQFGAKGDNSNNDTSSLQTALNFCSIHGLILTVPAGTYLSDGLTSSSVIVKGANATIKGRSNTNTTLLTLNSACEIDGIIFDANNLLVTALHTNVFKVKLTNCEFKNTTGDAIDNTAVEDEDSVAYFENLVFDNCVGGIRYLGYAYVDPDDYKCTIKFINCASKGNTGVDDTHRIYFFNKVNYVRVEGGDFTGDSTYGATNLYQVNHGEIIGGYYHDINRGVTLGQITKNCVVTNTINENITGSGGLDIDLVTNDRVYPLAHSVISNNVVKNSYRGIYVQGKNMVVNNNYIYCGSNTATQGGIVRFNVENSNTADSNIFVDNLFVLNAGSITGIINCGTAVIHFGKNIFMEGSGVGTTSFTSDNPALFQNKISITGNTNLNITDDIVVADATNGSFNIYLPKNNETNVCGKTYTIIRTDSSAYSISLRCRSDGGTINGHASAAGVDLITTGVTRVIQLSKGEYYTY